MKNKYEKRRAQLQARNAKREKKIAKYGNGSVAIMAQDVNRRFVAAFLALVFVLTSVIIGYNFSSKAVTGDQVAMDGTYEYNFSASRQVSGGSSAKQTPAYKATLSCENGVFTSVSITCTNKYNSTDSQKKTWDSYVDNGIKSFLTKFTATYTSDRPPQQGQAESQIVGKPATYETINNITARNYADTQDLEIANGPTRGWLNLDLKNGLLETIKLAPTNPKPNQVIDDDEEYIPELPTSAENNLITNKTISATSNGNYSLELESYSTANLKEYDVVEKIPTDFVIVVDQSGSMSTSDMPVTYSGAGNNIPLETIADGQYYYSDGENTYRVFAERGYLYQYFAKNKLHPGDVIPASAYQWFTNDSNVDIPVTNAYYYLDESDNEFHQLHFQLVGRLLRYHITPSYTRSNGTPVTKTAPDKPTYKNVIGALGDLEPGTGLIGDSITYTTANIFCKLISPTAYTYAQIESLSITTGMYFDFPMYKRKVGYTRLLYRDNDGVIHEVPSDSSKTSTVYCNSSGQAITAAGGSTRMTYSGLLKAKTTETRLKTLNTALKDFAKALQAERDSYGPVDNKVSIVGFSSLSSTTVDKFENTEVLTGTDLVTKNFETVNGSSYYSLDGNAHNGVQYNAATTSTYENALLSANDDHSKIIDAINAVTAYGGTQPEYGFEMAKQILQNRSVTTFVKKSGANKGQSEARNTIVIFFTDGEPGNNSRANRYTEANEVVAAAKDVKDMGATVFSIGVFGNSDGEPLEYPAHIGEKNDDYEYEDGWFETVQSGGDYIYLNRYWHSGDSTKYGETATDTIYDYMSVVSSNYPSATGFISDDWDESGDWLSMIKEARDPGNNATETNEYYRLAANQETLIAAFRRAITINETEPETVEGAVSDTAVVKDVINLENFNIPENPTVTITVVDGTKASEDADISFSETPNTPSGITYEWGADKKTITVKGFNFNDKYIANTHPGQKLIVQIDGLTPKANITGDALTSNESTSGIYGSDAEDAELLKEFPAPSISRYKYTLNVGNIDTDAVFDVNYSISPAEGAATNGKSILLRDGSTGVGQTLENLSNGTFSKSNIGNDATVYAEYITNQGADGNVNPSDYNLSIALTPASSDASTYTYYLSDTEFLYGDAQADRAILSAVSPVSMLTTQNGNLYVTSKANNKTVTIRNITEGEYADTSREFPITVTLTKDGSAATDFNETINGVTFTNGVATIPMKDGDSISITLPTGYGLNVADNSNPPAYSNITYKLDAGDFSTTPVSTDTNADRDIAVKHIRDEVTDTGVLEETNPLSLIMYVLAGALAIAAGGTAYYSKRKKEEN